MLRYGCTRLEIGVQSVYEDVARDTNRGHTVKAVSESFQLAKDAGYKVVSHMMPDLPNVGMERDIEQFKEYFENPAFRSDGLKIYPTLVIRGTGLYELWRTGRYKNYTPNALIDLVARILALVPPWTRIYRVQRDIPMPLVTSGVENGNLRELALNRMKDLGTECRDVRTREVGITEIHNKIKPDQVELIRRDYVANGGWETFLSYEDPHQDILIGLLRLRKCSPQTFRPELTSAGQTSIVRELHVYGSVVPMHNRDPTKFQHQGFGTLLMEEAERIAREEHGSVKLSVISGVGVRHYYAKLGYYLDGKFENHMTRTVSHHISLTECQYLQALTCPRCSFKIMNTAILRINAMNSKCKYLNKSTIKFEWGKSQISLFQKASLSLSLEEALLFFFYHTDLWLPTFGHHHTGNFSFECYSCGFDLCSKRIRPLNSQHWLLDRWTIVQSRQEDLKYVSEVDIVKLNIWFCNCKS